jgi:hypothetical protein
MRASFAGFALDHDLNFALGYELRWLLSLPCTSCINVSVLLKFAEVDEGVLRWCASRV